MGKVIYAFEVQTHGSIDSLILNLQKATNNFAVQAIVAVSDEKPRAAPSFVRLSYEKGAALLFEFLYLPVDPLRGDAKPFRQAFSAQKLLRSPVHEFPEGPDLIIGQGLSAFHTDGHYRSTTFAR